MWTRQEILLIFFPVHRITYWSVYYPQTTYNILRKQVVGIAVPAMVHYESIFRCSSRELERNKLWPEAASDVDEGCFSQFGHDCDKIFSYWPQRPSRLLKTSSLRTVIVQPKAIARLTGLTRRGIAGGSECDPNSPTSADKYSKMRSTQICCWKLIQSERRVAHSAEITACTGGNFAVRTKSLCQYNISYSIFFLYVN